MTFTLSESRCFLLRCFQLPEAPDTFEESNFPLLYELRRRQPHLRTVVLVTRWKGLALV